MKKLILLIIAMALTLGLSLSDNMSTNVNVAQSNPLMLLFTPAAGDTTHYVNATKIIGDGDLDLTAITTNQLLVPQVNDQTNPTIAFNGGGTANTGFFENTDNSISVSVNSTSRFKWSGNSFIGVAAGAGALLNEAVSKTNPTFNLHRTYDATGIGGAQDTVSIIINSIEIMRITANGFSLPTVGSDSTAVGVGEFYLKSGALTINYAD